MPNKLIVLFLIEQYISIDFVIQNEQLKIMPNTQNQLQPFQVIESRVDKEEDNQTQNQQDVDKSTDQKQTELQKDNNIILELQCGQYFDQDYQLQINDEKIACNESNMQNFKNFQLLNEFLNNINISVLKNFTHDNTSINYKVKYDENKTFEIYQKVVLYKEIPIYLKNTTLSTDNIETGNFQQQILNIEKEYLSKTDQANIQLLEQSNNFPSWLSYMIKDSVLVFYGAYPEEQTQNIVVNFKLFDKSSGLYSQNIDFWILKNYQETSEHTFKIFTVLFIIMFIMIIILFVYLLFRFMQKRSKKEQLKRSIEGHNMRRQESSTYQGATVLSQSILQWNKQLVVYHREKSKTPDKRKRQNKDNIKNKSYEDFDHQYSFEERSEDSNDIEDMKDISKIDSLNGQNIEKSSFLSGIKINQFFIKNLQNLTYLKILLKLLLIQIKLIFK